MPIVFALFDTLIVWWTLSLRLTERGMQARNELYYDSKIETAEGTHTAAVPTRATAGA